MKSIKLFFTLLILGVSLNFASAALPAFPEEVALRDLTDPVQPERMRSLLPTCSGLITDNYFTIYVHKYIGVATAVAKNTTTGATYSVEFNSDSEVEATIAEELTAGVYVINVYGADGYEAEGNFKIE